MDREEYYAGEEPEDNENLEEEVEIDGIDYDIDPGLVAYLDQEGAEFAAQAKEFEQLYGFKHDCKCAQDYAEGKLAQVTECYLGLTDDALSNCARMNWENQALQGMVSVVSDINEDLIKIIDESDLEVNTEELLQKALLGTFEDEGGTVEPDSDSIEDTPNENA